MSEWVDAGGEGDRLVTEDPPSWGSNSEPWDGGGHGSLWANPSSSSDPDSLEPSTSAGNRGGLLIASEESVW